jgi:hypothetical protein
MDMDTITQEIKFAIDFCLLVVANHWNLRLFFCLSSADKITKYEKGETMRLMCTARVGRTKIGIWVFFCA